jgi:hypothetical protein
MALDKRCIFALSEKEKNILDNFCNAAKIKKSKFIRTIIKSLEGVSPSNQAIEIIISGNCDTFKSVSIYTDGKKGSIDISDYSKVLIPFETDIYSDGKGNITKTKKQGGSYNVQMD